MIGYMLSSIGILQCVSNKRPEFFKLNPNGQVPLLDTLDNHVCENIAIACCITLWHHQSILTCLQVESHNTLTYLAKNIWLRLGAIICRRAPAVAVLSPSSPASLSLPLHLFSSPPFVLSPFPSSGSVGRRPALRPATPAAGRHRQHGGSGSSAFAAAAASAAAAAADHCALSIF
ncbi:hypothetical protein H5410_035168 [Solanum commersonii]|uniref:Uncharacterized protein n=1 Tax=Solanum commersonii TaxID=4109 RepID=A0A9J5Y309_SOLCO|nr:hypothetical protein H5410_035168 [Solanum commersonii]